MDGFQTAYSNLDFTEKFKLPDVTDSGEQIIINIQNAASLVQVYFVYLCRKIDFFFANSSMLFDGSRLKREIWILLLGAYLTF